MKKPILALDVDNTICNSNAILEGFVPSFDGSKYPAPGVTPQVFEDNPWIFTEAPPMPFAVQAVNKLAETWQIVYLTARPDWAKETTVGWLKQHGFPGAKVVCSENKQASVIKLGIILAIDDAPNEILSMGSIVPVLIFDHSYNRDLDGMRLSSWEGEEWKILLKTQQETRVFYSMPKLVAI